MRKSTAFQLYVTVQRQGSDATTLIYMIRGEEIRDHRTGNVCFGRLTSLAQAPKSFWPFWWLTDF